MSEHLIKASNPKANAWSDRCVVRALAVLATLALSGCMSPTSPRVFTVAPELAAPAALAAAEWTAACGTWISFGDGGMPIETVADLGTEEGTTKIYGEEHASFGIRVLPGLGPDETRAVLAHEMGHALGLYHTDHGIMRPLTGPDEHVTAGDCPPKGNF